MPESQKMPADAMPGISGTTPPGTSTRPTGKTAGARPSAMPWNPASPKGEKPSARPWARGLPTGLLVTFSARTRTIPIPPPAAAQALLRRHPPARRPRPPDPPVPAAKNLPLRPNPPVRPSHPVEPAVPVRPPVRTAPRPLPPNRKQPAVHLLPWSATVPSADEPTLWSTSTIPAT